jgi:hypothetical protein
MVGVKVGVGKSSAITCVGAIFKRRDSNLVGSPRNSGGGVSEVGDVSSGVEGDDRIIIVS